MHIRYYSANKLAGVEYFEQLRHSRRLLSFVVVVAARLRRWTLLARVQFSLGGSQQSCGQTGTVVACFSALLTSRHPITLLPQFNIDRLRVYRIDGLF